MGKRRIFSLLRRVQIKTAFPVIAPGMLIGLEARQHGLRYSRGMNHGLSQLWKEDKFNRYDAFFCSPADTELLKSTDGIGRVYVCPWPVTAG